MKYLVLLAVLAVAYGLWRSQRRPQPPARQADARRGPAQIQDMVACAHCGLHLPRPEALERDGRHYCSPAHRQQGPA